MKLLLFLCLLLSPSLFAQPVEISDRSTVSLVFPFPVVHVDRGHSSVSAQLIAENKKVLLVKATSHSLEAANLSVITSDGSVFALRLCYASEPSQLVIRLPEQNSASTQRVAENIIDYPRHLRRPKASSWDMTLSLTGSYVKDGIIYFQLELVNESSIDYPISLLRFSIRDQHKQKRSSVQEVDCTPLSLAGYHSLVPAGTRRVIVAAFDQFTIPDRKYFSIQFMEANGGRHLKLKVSNRAIVNAIRLPPFVSHAQ